MSLQGCGDSPTRHAFVEEENNEQKSAPADFTGGANKDDNAVDQQMCNKVVEDASKEFQKNVKQAAPDYFTRVVETFGEDFIKYPFCHENAEHVVNRVRDKIESNKKYESASAFEKNHRIDQAIKDQFEKKEEKWEKSCRNWSEKSKQHQLTRLDMVRKTLDLKEKDISDKQLKAEIKDYYDAEPWWHFFKGMSRSGCMRIFAEACDAPVKAAKQNAQDIVAKATGETGLTWSPFLDKPVHMTETEQSLLQHQQGRENMGQPARPHFLESNMVPVDVKPKGQQAVVRRKRGTTVVEMMR
jgi:hypothetical protein